MNEKINVGFDGTDASIEAVMWAAHEADLRRLPLRIVSCFAMPALAGADPHGWAVGEAFVNARTEAELALREMLATAAAVYPDVAITTDVSSDPVDAVLLDEAGSDDLVVVGASSHPGAAAFWLGSTPRHLVHRSPCAIVVVRGPASRGGPERVVVGIDPSAPAQRALDWAVDEADVHHVPLVVVHAWSVPADHVGVDRDIARIDAACILEGAVALARQLGGAAVDSVLVESDPLSALLETVRDGDHLVLGSRGRGAVRSALFGSTVNGVLDAAAVPVIVIREAPLDLHGSSPVTAVDLVDVG